MVQVQAAACFGPVQGKPVSTLLQHYPFNLFAQRRFPVVLHSICQVISGSANTFPTGEKLPCRTQSRTGAAVPA
ncbi:hypothetical protein NMN79_004461 [Salmonella enterica]|nr:hypothetical protein [Salmonella enterica]